MSRRRIPYLTALAALLLLPAACAPGALPPAPVAVPATTTAPAAAQVAPQATPTVQVAAATEPVPIGVPLPSATAPSPADTGLTASPSTPDQSATAEPSVEMQEASLTDEIFMAGAPSFAIVLVCEPPADASGRGVSWQQAGGSVGLLCLYGFQDGEEVQYRIIDSEGGEVGSGISTADTMEGPPPTVRTMFNIEAYPKGEWSVSAGSATASVDGTFEVTEPEGPVKVALLLKPGEAPAQAGRDLWGLKLRDDITVRAVHLAPDADVPVGVYYAAEETFTGSAMTLHEQALLPTDEAGTLSARLTLDPTYAPGFYCVVVALAADYKPERDSGEGGASECFTVTAN